MFVERLMEDHTGKVHKLYAKLKMLLGYVKVFS